MEQEKNTRKKRNQEESEHNNQQLKNLEKSKKKIYTKKTQKEPSDDEYESCSSMSEGQEISIQKKKSKKKSKKVRINEQANQHLEQDQYDDEEEIVDKADLEYEDDYYDEYEKEEIVNQEEEEEKIQKTKPYLGTDKDLKEDEELDFDNRAYDMFHRANVEWPCLSLDFLLPPNSNYMFQNPGYTKMEKYPIDTYLTAGSQTGTDENFIYLFKMTNLHKTKFDDDSIQVDSEEENIDDEPNVVIESIKISRNVNRIRAMFHQPIIAYWQDDGSVNIMDARDRFNALYNQEQSVKTNNNFTNIKCNSKTFKNSDEGFALDWSYLKAGFLLSGSCDAKIHLYYPKNENFSDIVRVSNPYTIHQGSVEDIQWSPQEETEFASCSVDGTVQIVDIRTNDKSKSQIKIKAHSCDVNVISWCKANTNLIASGADNGEVKIWDKRYIKNPYSEIDFHKEPITSIQFQPNDETTVAVSSADNRLTVWDFAVENDDEEEEMNEEIPEQLMFIHQGQKDIKEIRYHPIYYEMLVSTAESGINLFKPSLDISQSELNSERDQREQKDQIPEINEKDLNKFFGNMNLGGNQ